MTAEELKVLPFTVRPDEKNSIALRIVIYSYSSGKETISMTGDSVFKIDTGSGVIKALVEFIDNGKVVKADFIEVSGSSKDELLGNLVKSVLNMTGN